MNVLFIMLIWLPLDGVVDGSVQADFVKQTFATSELCDKAKDGDIRVMWNSKPGHRMIGYTECTDGDMPTSVSIGQFNVTVESALGGDGG